MLLAPACKLHQSAQVLDACAAPGVKQPISRPFLSAGSGWERITALDIHPHKVKLILKRVLTLVVVVPMPFSASSSMPFS